MLVSFLSHTFAATASLPPILLNMYLWNSRARALSRPLLFTLVSVVVVVDVCCCMLSSSFLPPPRTRKSRKKTCDLRLSSLSFCISTHTIMLPSSSSSSLAVGVLQLVGQPVQALVQTVAAGCARCLNVPVAVPQRVQAQLVGDFGGVHRIW